MILTIKENKLFLMRKHFQLLTKNQKHHHYVMKEKFLKNFNKFYNSSINRNQKNKLKRKKKFKMIYPGDLEILMKTLFKKYLMKQVLRNYNYMLSRLMKQTKKKLMMKNSNDFQIKLKIKMIVFIVRKKVKFK